MQARALKNLTQLPPAKRLDVIAEGLELLVEHVTTLTDDLTYLSKGGRWNVTDQLIHLSEYDQA